MAWISASPLALVSLPVAGLLQSDLFIILIISDLAVLSIDLTATRIVGVIGPRTCFAGMKFMTALIILLPTDCLDRIRTEREFSVAFTRRGSL